QGAPDDGLSGCAGAQSFIFCAFFRAPRNAAKPAAASDIQPPFRLFRATARPLDRAKQFRRGQHSGRRQLLAIRRAGGLSVPAPARGDLGGCVEFNRTKLSSQSDQSLRSTSSLQHVRGEVPIWFLIAVADVT